MRALKWGIEYFLSKAVLDNKPFFKHHVYKSYQFAKKLFAFNK